MTHMNITLEQVKKDYSRRTIVEDVNLEIKEGETVVLSGHNGTGKSTLLRIIGGLTTPTEGSVRYQEKYKIGYVPEHFRPTDMSARKYFWHVGQIEGLSPQAVRKRSDMLMDLFFMQGMEDIPMKHMSKGTLQKVAVIQSILSPPDLLLLDEPLSGQDVESQKKFIALMNALKEQGMGIVMSCHEVYLMSQMADRVYQIQNKKLIERDRDFTDFSLLKVLAFQRQQAGAEIGDEVRGLCENIREEDQSVRMKVSGEHSDEVISRMLQNGWSMRSMV